MDYRLPPYVRGPDTRPAEVDAGAGGPADDLDPVRGEGPPGPQHGGGTRHRVAEGSPTADHPAQPLLVDQHCGVLVDPETHRVHAVSLETRQEGHQAAFTTALGEVR